MSKFIYLLSLFSALSCNLPVYTQSMYVGGIWIPASRDQGNFTTYCISNDSSVVVINSTQKMVGDSIVFQAEPGVTIRKGRLKWTGKEFEICAKYIFPYYYNNKSLTEKIPVVASIIRYELELVIGKQRYRRAFMYTQESKERIYNIVSRVVPELERKMKGPN